MSRLYNSFDFVGELAFPKEPTVDSEMGTSGWRKKRQSLIIKESKQNSAFVQLEAIYHPNKESKVFTSQKGLFGEKISNVQINWDDRLTPSIVDSVPDFKKIIVDLTSPDTDKQDYFNLRRDIYNLESKEKPTDEDKSKLLELYEKARTSLPDRHEFLHMYDAIDFLKDKLEGLKGVKVRIKGDISLSHYNGKFYTNYVPKTIELVSDEYVNNLKLNLDLFFKKDAIEDKSEKEGLVYFDTYLLSYDNQHKKDVFFPFPTVLNVQKLDLTNERHVAILNVQKKPFGSAKSKEVKHIAVEAKVWNGADEVDFDETKLTSQQKEMIELGLASIEDFKPKGTLLGETVKEIRVIKPLLQKLNEKNDFTEGAVLTVYEPSELEYVAPEGQSKPAPKEEVKPKEEDKLPDAFEEDDLEALFG